VPTPNRALSAGQAAEYEALIELLQEQLNAYGQIGYSIWRSPGVQKAPEAT
jgi:hypothetical protein